MEESTAKDWVTLCPDPKSHAVIYRPKLYTGTVSYIGKAISFRSVHFGPSLKGRPEIDPYAILEHSNEPSILPLDSIACCCRIHPPLCRRRLSLRVDWKVSCHCCSLLLGDFNFRMAIKSINNNNYKHSQGPKTRATKKHEHI